MTRGRLPDAILRWWPLARVRLRGRDEAPIDPPLRAHLLGAEALAEQGAALAASHVLARGRAPDRLPSRLPVNQHDVLPVCAELARLRGGPRIPPAGEWLLDNVWLIEQQI